MIKKISAAVLALTFTLSTTAHANVPSHTLTLRQATERAQRNSTALRTLTEDVDMAREELDRTQSLFPGSGNMIEVVNWQTNLLRQQANITAHIQNIDAQRATAEFLALSHFANIFTAENQLVLFDQQMALTYQNLTILRAQQALGLASELDYLLATLSFEEMATTREQIVSSIAGAHRELNRLMGTVDEDRIHTILWELEHETVAPVRNLQGLINHQRQNHINVRQAQELQRVAEFQVDNFITPTNPVTGEVIPGNAGLPTREQRQIAVNDATRQLVAARNQISTHLQDTYTNIRLTEHHIQTAHMELENITDNLAIALVQLSLGMVLPVTIDSLELQIANHKEQIRQLEMNHYLLVMQFQNPNILVF